MAFDGGLCCSSLHIRRHLSLHRCSVPAMLQLNSASARPLHPCDAPLCMQAGRGACTARSLHDSCCWALLGAPCAPLLPPAATVAAAPAALRPAAVTGAAHWLPPAACRWPGAAAGASGAARPLPLHLGLGRPRWRRLEPWHALPTCCCHHLLFSALRRLGSPRRLRAPSPASSSSPHLLVGYPCRPPSHRACSR